MNESYLLALSAERDNQRTAPYLEALSEVYSVKALAFPIIDPLGEGVIETVENATASVVFLTPNALEDELLKASINHLLHKDVPLLVIYFEDVTLPAGLQFQLSLSPVFFPNRHETLASALETLKNAPYLKKAFGKA